MLRLNSNKILESKQIAVTKHRVSILNSFINYGKPITLKTLRLDNPLIDRVTLFRALSILEQKKIIHKITIERGQVLYALCKEKCNKKDDCKHNHIHFLCNQCDDVTCLEVENFPSINVPDVLINNLNINASGICEKCNYAK